MSGCPALILLAFRTPTPSETVLLDKEDQSMNPNELIIRYEMVDRQTEGAVSRLVGLVRARNLLSLFDAADPSAS